MHLKIKSTLNFVKLWPQESRREEFSVTLISRSKEEANDQGSLIIASNLCIEKNEEGQIVYQVYLKSTTSEKSYVASEFMVDNNTILLDSPALFDFIINEKLRLVPTTLDWVTEDGSPATFVTHDVYKGKERYQGMSVNDIIHSIVNKTVIADLSED